MSYLPAPYESGARDDLPAALGAGLTVTVAGITSWVLGHWGYAGIRRLIDLGRATSARALPKDLLVPTVGWAASVVLMVIGGLLLTFKHGRATLLLGALASIATTAIARYSYQYGTPSVPVAQWALYWGGVAVFVLAVLPATGRWLSKAAQPTMAFPASAIYLPS